MRKRIPSTLRRRIRKQAQLCCEYCHASEELTIGYFHIDHIVPVAKGGTNKPDNLAFACPFCNENKLDKTHAIDPFSGKTVRLFHPRKDNWNTHFIWSADRLEITSLTPIGRATVAELEMNDAKRVYLRRLWTSLNLHPPEGNAKL